MAGGSGGEEVLTMSIEGDSAGGVEPLEEQTARLDTFLDQQYR
jgi:hypothetical protein